jgi:hypothetical protein
VTLSAIRSRIISSANPTDRRRCRRHRPNSASTAARPIGRHSRVHCRERSTVEGKGLKMDCVGGMKNQTLRQVFFGS